MSEQPPSMTYETSIFCGQYLRTTNTQDVWVVKSGNAKQNSNSNSIVFIFKRHEPINSSYRLNSRVDSYL